MKLNSVDITDIATDQGLKPESAYPVETTIALEQKIVQLEARILDHALTYDAVAECMLGMGFNPEECELGEVMCAVRKLAHKALE